MLQGFLTELARAPLWAQVGMGLFAATFLYMASSSYLTNRRYASPFAGDRA